MAIVSSTGGAGGTATVVVTFCVIVAGGVCAVRSAPRRHPLATLIAAAAYKTAMARVIRSLLLLALAIPALGAQARVRSVGSRLDRASRILIVTAHPDDEVLLAPLLALRCLRGGAHCSFLVMTEGESGTCARPGGCAPNLGSVRAGEMAKAAALFHATLTQWTFPDVVTGVDAAWSTYAGRHDLVVQRLADAIALEQPDTILTFDPDHGTTGHEAHRTIASLVLETGAHNVLMLETAAQFVENGFVLSNAKPERASVLFAGEEWEWLLRDAELHESQFSAVQLESLRNLPLDQRRVWWLAP
jgi:LmbE family N-acetylglucosaminyl deacetylase